jgi:DNA polymerase-1
MRLLLVDGHSVAFRAYHAIPASLVDRSGRPANVLYGFLNTLFRVLQDRRPTHLAVTFDLGQPFRVAMYAGYKASREMGPEDLEPQVAELRLVLAALGIPIFELEGWEADDLLATLARQAGARRMPVDILSGDLDVLQLVGRNVHVVAPGKTFAEPVVYDAARVRGRFGVGPEKLRDWKALVGDASDEIPGVRGIGRKSATELLQRFGSLEALYRRIDSVESARFRNLLLAGRDQALLSQRLVTLRDDAPVALDLDACRLDRLDRAAGAERLAALGLGGIARRVAGGTATPPQVARSRRSR